MFEKNPKHLNYVKSSPTIHSSVRNGIYVSYIFIMFILKINLSCLHGTASLNVHAGTVPGDIKYWEKNV